MTVILACNGEEAVAKAQLFSPNIILMDMCAVFVACFVVLSLARYSHMPVMNGYEATRALRAIPSCFSIPVVALTADTISEQEEVVELIWWNVF